MNIYLPSSLTFYNFIFKEVSSDYSKKNAFKFINKCDWNQIYMRFDDWHGHEPDYDQHERLACKEWLEEKKYKYELLRNGNHGELIVSR